jgi:tRNA (cmo5U34)-methyltransferase
MPGPRRENGAGHEDERGPWIEHEQAQAQALHHHHEDENEIWRSDDAVATWLVAAEERERGRRPQRRLMAELLPFGDDDPFVFVDLGAGAGAAARAVLDRYPRASAVLADFSPQLAAAAERALAPYRGRFVSAHFDLAAGPWPASIPDPVDAVITSMALHHLPEARRGPLVAEVFARLAPGGWFLDFDLVAADDPSVDEAWRRTADRLEHDPDPEVRHPAPPAHQRHEWGALQVGPLADQLSMLREAGFAAVDTYWKQLDAVIIGGRRPA